MASKVEEILEKFIPTLEKFESLAIFTPEEIKKLILRWRNFEYKLIKETKNKRDFFQYAMFNTKFFELALLRMQGLENFNTPHEIIQPILLRMQTALNLMTNIWKTDPDVWSLKISVFKSMNFKSAVSHAFSQQIQHFGHDENLWVRWAQWELEGKEDIDKAREILLSRAPLYHPKSLMISKEYFRLEFLYIEHLQKILKKNKSSGHEAINIEKILKGAIPKAVYKQASIDFGTEEFYMQFFLVANHFKFLKSLQSRIFWDFMEKYPRSGEIWQLKSLLVMMGEEIPPKRISKKKKDIKEGIESDKEPNDESKKVAEEIVESLEKVAIEEQNSESKCEKSQESLADNSQEEVKEKEDKKSFQQKLENVLSLYEEGLCTVGPPFLEMMLRDLLPLLFQSWGVKEYMDVFAKMLVNVLRRPSLHAFLTPWHFIIWYELSSLRHHSKKKLINILMIASSMCPTSEFIQCYMLPYSFTKKEAEIKKLVRSLSNRLGAETCMKMLKELKMPLCRQALINTASMHHDPVLARHFKDHLLGCCPDDNEGLVICRELFEKYSNLPPFSLRLFVNMIMREMNCSPPDQTRLRSIFGSAVDKFGKNEPVLWHTFIEFEREAGNMKQVSDLTGDAHRTLSNDKLTDFIDYKFSIEKCLSDEGDVFTFDGNVTEEKEKKVTVASTWQKSFLGCLFAEDQVVTYSESEERTTFFLALTEAELKTAEWKRREYLEKGIPLKVWEDLLSLTHGRLVSLRVRKSDEDDVGVKADAISFVAQIDEIEQNKADKNQKFSDRLKPNSTRLEVPKIFQTKEESILESSDTLQSGFLQKKEIAPYYYSARARKEKAEKAPEAMTAGPDWFNMKCNELNDKTKLDFEMFKMRDNLHPQRHYKTYTDLKEMPKVFQMGRVGGDPMDAFQKIPRKQRKRTFAEEIVNEERVMRFQKRRYDEIWEEDQERKTRYQNNKTAEKREMDLSKRKRRPELNHRPLRISKKARNMRVREEGNNHRFNNRSESEF